MAQIVKASNGQCKGDHRHQFGSNSKGGPQASIGSNVRGDHRHQIWVK